MHYRIRKLDPLLLLALAVGLGVVVTTTVQAESPANPPEGTAAGQSQVTVARWALRPVRGLAERLEMHWLNRTLERAAVEQLLSHEPLAIAKPLGAKGPELSLGWRPRLGDAAAQAGDSGIGTLSSERPDIYIGLRRRW
ncbi:MAG: hypothetical protein ABR553_06255 [Gammaproteobacteria bacterium]